MGRTKILICSPHNKYILHVLERTASRLGDHDSYDDADAPGITMRSLLGAPHVLMNVPILM